MQIFVHHDFLRILGLGRQVGRRWYPASHDHRLRSVIIPNKSPTHQRHTSTTPPYNLSKISPRSSLQPSTFQYLFEFFPTQWFHKTLLSMSLASQKSKFVCRLISTFLSTVGGYLLKWINKYINIISGSIFGLPFTVFFPGGCREEMWGCPFGLFLTVCFHDGK